MFDIPLFWSDYSEEVKRTTTLFILYHLPHYSLHPSIAAAVEIIANRKLPLTPSDNPDNTATNNLLNLVISIFPRVHHLAIVKTLLIARDGLLDQVTKNPYPLLALRILPGTTYQGNHWLYNVAVN